MQQMPEIRVPVNNEIISCYFHSRINVNDNAWEVYVDELVKELESGPIPCLARCITLKSMSVDTHNGYQFADDRVGPLLIFRMPDFIIDIIHDAHYNVLESLDDSEY